ERFARLRPLSRSLVEEAPSQAARRRYTAARRARARARSRRRRLRADGRRGTSRRLRSALRRARPVRSARRRRTRRGVPLLGAESARAASAFGWSAHLPPALPEPLTRAPRRGFTTRRRRD